MTINNENINYNELEVLNEIIEDYDINISSIKEELENCNSLLEGLNYINDICDIRFNLIEDMEEYAENLVNECYDIPDFISMHIDYRGIADDLEIDMEMIYINNSDSIIEIQR